MDFLPVLSLASIMGSVVLLVGYIPIKNNIALLFSQVSTGIILYTLLCNFAKISSFFEIRSMAQEIYGSIRHRDDIF